MRARNATAAVAAVVTVGAAAITLLEQPASAPREVRVEWQDSPLNVNPDPDWWAENQPEDAQRWPRSIRIEARPQSLEWWTGLASRDDTTPLELEQGVQAVKVPALWEGCIEYRASLEWSCLVWEPEGAERTVTCWPISEPSNVVTTDDPCIDPPPERVPIAVPEPGAWAIVVLVIVLALVARRRWRIPDEDLGRWR